MANRRHQHGEVVNAAGEDCADQNPQEAGRESELRCQGWTNQRSGTGYGCEVMPEQHPLRRRHVVVSVFVNVRRSDPCVVEGEHFGGKESAVKAIGQRKHTECSQKNGKGIHGTSPRTPASGMDGMYASASRDVRNRRT